MSARKGDLMISIFFPAAPTVTHMLLIAEACQLERHKQPPDYHLLGPFEEGAKINPQIFVYSASGTKVSLDLALGLVLLVTLRQMSALGWAAPRNSSERGLAEEARE